MISDGRVVVWFSCGAASACAAKLAVDKHENVRVVYCNTLASEHPDNQRFLWDVESWIHSSIEVISSNKYRDIDEVFEKAKYMSGIAGARCTTELKKIPRFDYQLPNDLHIFGLTADETKRIERFESTNPELELEWNLRDAGMTKEDCYQLLRDAGIALPIMYSLGFKNNNCIGCVKATSPAYWYKVRQHFPEIFKRRAEQSRKINCRLVRYHGQRIFLDELPEVNTDHRPEEDIECGPICVGTGLVGLQNGTNQVA
jgi:hypothetical protein